ncbi:MAG: hypothetical protein HYV63_10140 [Candidatus Schekmanbacteria bacterium]|nr:hypothetical protein [Candidatus Schekmanbacteria bacterium]
MSLSLLEVVQNVIEQLYGLQPAGREIDRFIIGDQGYRRLYEQCREVAAVGSAAPGQARVLINPRQDGLRLALYYPDRLIVQLEGAHPFHGLDASNVGGFGVFIEELDHLLQILDRTWRRLEFSLLELELLGYLTRYLVLAHFLRRQHRRSCGRSAVELPPAIRQWLQREVFETTLDPSLDPHLQQRYQDAASLSRRFLDFLDGRAAGERLQLLRHFQRLPYVRKMAALAAIGRGDRSGL